MSMLITSVIIVLVVSALCSLSEAALYAVRMPYVRQLVEQGDATGRRLEQFKKNMERPITAILILNTAANTAGAAVAGGQAREILGENSLIWFSACFTLAVLFFSEIIPKVAGVAFNRPIARMLSTPIDLTIKLLFPLVWLSQKVAGLLTPNTPTRLAPEEEVWHFAAMSAEEGSILPIEAELIKNVLRLNDVVAKDIMTPRTVVTRVTSGTPIGKVKDSLPNWHHTRIPVVDSDDPDKWIGFALKEEIIGQIATGNLDGKIEDLCKPIEFVADNAQGHFMLNELINRRQHLFGVNDEYGAVVGIVTLEDVIESLVGREIVDETDTNEDMQAVARRDAATRPRAIKDVPNKDQSKSVDPEEKEQ